VEYEGGLLDKNQEGTLSDAQLKDAMSRSQKKREEVVQKLNAIKKEIRYGEADSVKIPEKMFIDSEEISRDLLRELAHKTFKEIKVFGDRVELVLIRVDPFGREHNDPLTIMRVTDRAAKDLPFYRVRVNSAEITKDSKIGVGYFYKSTALGLYQDGKKNPVWYYDGRMEINGLGNNQSVDKKRSKIKTKPSSMDEFMKGEFGEPPGYGRNIVFQSNVFFGPLMTKHTTEEEIEEERQADIRAAAGQKGRKK